MWMGGDPIASVDFLGDAIHHVHTKDTYLNASKVATTTRLENGPLDNVADRSWWHVTLGYGHVELLQTVAPIDPADYRPQGI